LKEAKASIISEECSTLSPPEILPPNIRSTQTGSCGIWQGLSEAINAVAISNLTIADNSSADHELNLYFNSPFLPCDEDPLL
jgi:hypothetical protein